MKTFSLLLLSLTLIFAEANAQQKKPSLKPASKSKNGTKSNTKPASQAEIPVATAEKMPEFPGGEEALETYFINALTAVELPQASAVRVQLVTDRTGKVKSAKVKQGYARMENGNWVYHPEIDSAVVKAARTMPNWQPATNLGKPVSAVQELWVWVMTPEEAKNVNEQVFVFVEQQPEFPGGNQAMMDYLIRNLKYPEDAVQNKIEGRVILQFVVGRFGEIKEAQILKSVSESIDQEALRIIREMPRWKPGKQNGRAVNVRYTMPLMFKL